MYYKEAKEIYAEMTSTCEQDVSEAGLIHKALMPTAQELSFQTLMADEITKRIFARTALDNGYYDEFIKICASEGIYQKDATTATGIIKITGTKDSKLPTGAIVSTVVGIQYTTNDEVTLDDTGVGYANITASAEGSKYNCEIGDISILPVKYVGILSVTNEKAITNGYDLEDYEDMYDRYLVKIQAPPTSGNKAHYKSWCLECTGVGNAYVVPLWDRSNGRNGRGTVKCVIADSNRQGASNELIQTVKNYIDPYPEGEGCGQAPIGSIVTVVSAEEIKLDINCSISYDSKANTSEELTQAISDVVTEYLKKVAFEIKHISIAKIGALIMSLDMVNDYEDLTVNNETYRVNISDEQIPVLGDITFTIIEEEA